MTDDDVVELAVDGLLSCGWGRDGCVALISTVNLGVAVREGFPGLEQDLQLLNDELMSL